MAIARHKQASRKPKRQRRRQPLAICRNPNDDFTIEEWCRKRRISRGLFYKMLQAGSAPRTVKIFKRRIIPFEADAEWQAAREAEAA